MNSVTLFLFPGLLFVLALAGALAAIIEGLPRPGDMRLPRFGFESAMALASTLLTALGSVLLPWPLGSPQTIGLFAGPFAALLVIEGAFLVALLPGLLAADALVNRATIREAQIGGAGRAVLWVTLGTLLWQGEAWTLASLPGRLLLAAAGLLALPAAIGVGPFAADRGLTLSGAEHGLDGATAGFVRLARYARSAVLVGAALLAVVPQESLRPALRLLLWAAGTLVIALVLRRLNGRVPRLTLPSALHWCWWRALPLAAVGLIYLAIVP